MIYLISQIIGMIAFFFSLLAYHRNKKKQILGTMLVSNILNIIHYLLLGAYSGCLTKILATMRDTFIITKESNNRLSKNIFLYIFILLYILVGIVTFDNILSIFPIIAALIYLIPTWNGNEITVKKAAFACYFFWLVYNISILSISGILSYIVSIISTFIAIKHFKQINTNNLKDKC